MHTIHRGYRYKLEPTTEQEETFRCFAGVCRFLYNLALEQRDKMWTYYRDNGVPLNFIQQSRELMELRAEFDWIRAVPRVAEQAVLEDLDDAFKLFFRGVAEYPKYRRRGEDERFRVRSDEVRLERMNDKWGRVSIPKIGWVKLRLSRDIRGDIRSATVRLTPLGWFIAFTCAIEVDDVAIDGRRPHVGLDRGIANTVALSTGEMFAAPIVLTRAIDVRLHRAQRVLARRKKGSRRRESARCRVAALRAKKARIRRHWCHVTSRHLAERFSVIVVEDLDIAAMTASGKGKSKRGLNRSILEQGWGELIAFLKYKMEERGGTVVPVNPAYTSQTCASCGVIDKQSRESQARFVCRHCGAEAHADTNAAINILRRNTASMDVEGSRWRPDEASTGQVIAA